MTAHRPRHTGPLHTAPRRNGSTAAGTARDTARDTGRTSGRASGRRLLSAALAAALTLPVPALAFRALNRAEAVDLGNGSFEIINSFGSRAQDYWCGAGDYAIRVLGVPVTRRIYVRVPLGPSKARPGRKAVTFSLKEPPGGPAPKSYSLSVRKVGESIPASMAQNYCYDRMQLLF